MGILAGHYAKPQTAIGKEQAPAAKHLLAYWHQTEAVMEGPGGGQLRSQIHEVLLSQSGAGVVAVSHRRGSDVLRERLQLSCVCVMCVFLAGN